MRIRFAQGDDAAAIAAIYEPIVRDTTISFEEIAPTADEMRLRIENTTMKYPWLVAEDDGVLGYAYATEHRSRMSYRWSVDVSVYVRQDARRRGRARMLYAALFRLLEVQRFHRAFAGITLPNDASIALHRAFGFELVGEYREVGYKLGAWRNTSWWQKAISGGTSPIGDPISIQSLDPGVLRKALS